MLKTKKFFALVDCNSFYCSCERVWRPDLRGRPVIVLSNNDGCAIAFTKEAKALGLGEMCAPYFKIKPLIEKHQIAVFSSNYTLYDDMSKRVMETLRKFSPEMEIYSVDEAFLQLTGIEDLTSLGHKIRHEVLTHVGIPVGVGISRTKVLAKVANKIAKKNKGVCALLEEKQIDAVLKHFPVEHLWGIGHRSAIKLRLLGITSAYEFKVYSNEIKIQKILTKTGRQIQDELRGISCLPLDTPEDKKNTGTSRSFGESLFLKRDLKEAVATFATHASLKLRRQQSVCFGLRVFIQTPFFKEVPQYYGEGKANFISGTCDTIKIIKAAHQVLDEIYRPGYEYKKAGVLLTHIIPKNQNQLDLFQDQSFDDNEKLNQVVDLINKRYGPHTIKSAACGLHPQWKTVANYSSGQYTTSWKDLLKIK